MGGIWPVGDAGLITEEISLLSAIAAEHEGKGMKLARLVADWVEFQDALKAKMH